MVRFLLHFFLLILCIGFNSITNGQPPAIVKIAEGCSTQKMKTNLYYLASDKLEGRMMASHGDTLASQFLAHQFKKANLTAPYAGSYFQTIAANKKITTSSLVIGQKKYNDLDGWRLYPQVQLSLQNIQVIYNQFADLKSINDYIFTH